MFSPESPSNLYDPTAYSLWADAIAAGQPTDTAQACSSLSADESDGVLNQLAQLQLDRAGRRRASDAAPARPPRTALPGLGRSMRLLPPSAAAPVGRERYFNSARFDVPPHRFETPPDSPDRYAPQQPHLRYASYSTQAASFDAAPRRSGGFISSIKKGVKGLKRALGLGSKRTGISGDIRASSASFGAGPSMRHDSIFQMDAPSPGSQITHSAQDDAVDAQITRHDGSPDAASPPRGDGSAVNPGIRPHVSGQPTSTVSRRRSRQDRQWATRQQAGSSTLAEETTLPGIARPRKQARGRNSTGGGRQHPQTGANMRAGEEAINQLQTLLPLGPANQRRSIEASGGESTARYWLRESHGTVDSSADFGHQAVQYGGAVCSDYAGAAAGLLLGAGVHDPVALADVSLLEANDHRVALVGDPRVIGRENTVVVDAWANNPRARTLSETQFEPAVVQQYDPSQNAGVSSAQLHNGGYRIPRQQVDEFLAELELPPIGDRLVDEINELAPPYDY